MKYVKRHPDGRLEPAVSTGPEFGIRLSTGDVIVGPGWESVADVLDSYHGHGVTRVYGELVRRTALAPVWSAG